MHPEGARVNSSCAPHQAPEVSGLAPLRGPLSGGTAVTIHGARFTEDNVCVFGETEPKEVTPLFTSASELECLRRAGGQVSHSSLAPGA